MLYINLCAYSIPSSGELIIHCFQNVLKQMGRRRHRNMRKITAVVCAIKKNRRVRI